MRPDGFTLSNYVNILSNRFFINGLTNSLTIAAAAAVCTVLVGVPFAFCLARLPIGAKAALIALSALPLVLPSFVGAYALVLLFGRSGIVTGALHAMGIPFEFDLWGEGDRRGLHADALSVCGASGDRCLQVHRQLGRGGGAKPGLVTGACAAHSDTYRSCFRRFSPAALLVFIEALENFGVPFVLAEDKTILSVEAYKLFVGETTDNPSSAGVLGVLLVVCTIVALVIQRALGRAPDLCDRRAARGAAHAGQPRCPPHRCRVLLDHRLAQRWCHSSPWWLSRS